MILASWVQGVVRCRTKCVSVIAIKTGRTRTSSVLFTFTLQDANQEVLSTNDFGSVSDSLGRFLYFILVTQLHHIAD